jgi:hypothetical protein
MLRSSTNWTIILARLSVEVEVSEVTPAIVDN